ncbi:MAG: porin [Phycisphaerales bacterium]
MEREIQDLRLQLQAVREQQDRGLLDERRAEEVRSLIREVLSDADTRVTLLSQDVSATYDGGFVIRGEDTFLLKLNSYIHFRYLNNNAPELDDDEEGGFQSRDVALMLSGYIGSPRVSYMLMPTFKRGDGSGQVELAYVGYAIDDTWSILAGQFKAPLQREWLVSGKMQSLLERSYVNSLFSSLYVQGVQVTRQGGDTRLLLTMHDGTWSWQTDYDADRTDYALGARGEWKVFGDWKQFNDTLGWSGDHGMLIGAAYEFDRGETGGDTDTADLHKFSADIGLEGDGWNLFASCSTRRIDANGSPGILEADQWGALIQGGFFIVPDKVDVYARYEWLDVDGVAFKSSTGTTTATGNDVAQLVTVGTNYFLNGHNTKLSFDVVHAFDGLPVSDTCTAQRASDGPSTTLRGQVQVAF